MTAVKNPVLISLLLMLSQAVYADSAAYKGGVLFLPELLSVQADASLVLNNVELRINQAGTFDLHVAEQRKLAQLQSMSTDISVQQGDHAWIHMEGFKSLQCVELNPVSITRHGQDFHLAVTEQAIPENVRCLPGVHPFQLDVKLDTVGLEPGAYFVHAHELNIHFNVME